MQRAPRYDRKDYGERVEFPVEIVSRDGVVRRYPYDEAVLLYHRRHRLAHVRIADAELVRAEVAHCEHRIAQLRRSYFQQHGWPRHEDDDASSSLGAIAGELAFFLRRFDGQAATGALRLAPRRVGADGSGEWRLDVRGDSLLLDVVRLAESGHGTPHVQRARMLARRADRQVVALHHTFDCMFLVTAPLDAEPPALAEPAPGVDSWEEALVEAASGPWPRVLVATAALTQRFPWHRRAWAVGSATAIGAHAFEEARTFASAGLARCPEDPSLRLLHGIASFGMGRLRSGLTDLRDAHRRLPRDEEVDGLLLAAEYAVAAPDWIVRALRGPKGRTRRAGVNALAWRGAAVCTASLGIVAGAWGSLSAALAGIAMALLAELSRRALARLRWQARLSELALDQPIRVLRRFGRARDVARNAN